MITMEGGLEKRERAWEKRKRRREILANQEREKDKDYETFINNLRNIDGAFDYLLIIRDRMAEVGMDNYDGGKVNQWIKDGLICLDGFTTYVVRRYLWQKGLSWKQTETGGC